MISEAFKRLGISDSDSALLIVLVHPKEEKQHMSDIIAKVDGQQIPVEDVSMLTDPAKIKKEGLTEHTLQQGRDHMKEAPVAKERTPEPAS
ncbi:EKC/KEOPS complex subunit TPRKB-like isoform X2 [Oncorhynchus nerka]|uniref:EKC/KEOPS complex subunit TPRKB-like isoform X2 n=1 Tax=Oncorhynchus nerka TaxID=8023 RepID=UPI0031B800B1